MANVNQKQQTMIFHTVARVKKRLGLIAGTCCILNSWALTPKARIDHFSLQANTFGTLHNLGLMCALPFRLLSKDLLENTFIAQPTLTRLQNQHLCDCSHVLWKGFLFRYYLCFHKTLFHEAFIRQVCGESWSVEFLWSRNALSPSRANDRRVISTTATRNRNTVSHIVHSKSDGPLCWDVIAEW